jgi:ABC-2 type transport system permease protein
VIGPGVDSAREQSIPPPPVPEAGRLRSMLDVYLTLMKTSIIRGFQYRLGNYFYLIGMLIEPVVYLVVWSTIAREQGGSVEGFTPGDFAAYYIVWTLVRQMNIVFTPYGWEWRIKEGQLAGQLLRPLHPVHYDLADIAGWKFVVIVLWLPVTVALTLLFRPALSPTALEIGVFAVAIWGAYLLRSMNQTALGLVTFWTTRASAMFETYFVAELLLSGRLVPLQLMPQWVQNLAGVLPFKWTFGFPIEALTGDLSTAQLVGGLGMQALWTLAGWLLVTVIWRRAVRRFTSVGN